MGCVPKNVLKREINVVHTITMQGLFTDSSPRGCAGLKKNVSVDTYVKHECLIFHMQKITGKK